MPNQLSPVTTTSSRLEKFLAKIDPVRGRIIFALDATASRQPTWDTAAKLQREMFEAVSTIGGLDVQLVHYSASRCVASRWLADAGTLADTMAAVTCAAGNTQIGKVLAHARKENARETVNALIIVSDACEETPHDLYAEARELGAPVFMFQEGDDDRVAGIYAEIARLTGGAVAKFDSTAAQRLADLLRAVASFAVGGLKALAAQKTDAATLLLTQIKR
jgi:hypothetical protein